MSKIATVFHIRYSILMRFSRSWKISRKYYYDEYKKNLFSEKRMAIHRTLFENITIPSLDYQNFDPSFTQVQILTSSELPQKDREFLNDISASRKWIKVLEIGAEETDIFSGPMRQFFAETKIENGKYISVRLDDDDALSVTFHNELIDLAGAVNSEAFISCPWGVVLPYDYESGKIGRFYEMYYPGIALGLARVFPATSDQSIEKIESVFDIPISHARVPRERMYLSTPRRMMYLRTMYGQSDTESENLKNLRRKNIVESSEVLDSFPIEYINSNVPEEDLNFFLRDREMRDGTHVGHGRSHRTEQQLADIKMSRSWRWTAPARRVRRLIRGVLG